jgi:hypothetical protein
MQHRMRYEKVFANDNYIAQLTDKLNMSTENWWNDNEKESINI